MDYLNTVYSFNPTISIIMLIGIVIGIWGAIAEKWSGHENADKRKGWFRNQAANKRSNSTGER